MSPSDGRGNGARRAPPESHAQARGLGGRISRGANLQPELEDIGRQHRRWFRGLTLGGKRRDGVDFTPATSQVYLGGRSTDEARKRNGGGASQRAPLRLDAHLSIAFLVVFRRPQAQAQDTCAQSPPAHARGRRCCASSLMLRACAAQRDLPPGLQHQRGDDHCRRHAAACGVRAGHRQVRPAPFHRRLRRARPLLSISIFSACEHETIRSTSICAVFCRPTLIDFDRLFGRDRHHLG